MNLETAFNKERKLNLNGKSLAQDSLENPPSFSVLNNKKLPFNVQEERERVSLKTAGSNQTHLENDLNEEREGIHKGIHLHHQNFSNVINSNKNKTSIQIQLPLSLESIRSTNEGIKKSQEDSFYSENENDFNEYKQPRLFTFLEAHLTCHEDLSDHSFFLLLDKKWEL